MSDNILSSVDQKRQRFIKVAERRVNVILTSLDNLGKCSNKRNYEYGDDEVKEIFREIDRKVKEVRILFQGTGSKKKVFKLSGKLR